MSNYENRPRPDMAARARRDREIEAVASEVWTRNRPKWGRGVPYGPRPRSYLKGEHNEQVLEREPERGAVE
jgi:hypothetical protein